MKNNKLSLGHKEALLFIITNVYTTYISIRRTNSALHKAPAPRAPFASILVIVKKRRSIAQRLNPTRIGRRSPERKLSMPTLRQQIAAWGLRMQDFN